MDRRRAISLFNTATRWLLVTETIALALGLLYSPYFRNQKGTIELFYALVVQTVAFFLRLYSIPNQVVAAHTSNVLCLFGSAMSFKGALVQFRNSPQGTEYRQAFWDRLVCSLEVRDRHVSSGDELTREFWTSGRWCRDLDQRIPVLERGVLAYMASIDASRCYRVCYEPVKHDNATLHSFVSSAPGGQVPTTEYCGVGPCLGLCFEDETCVSDTIFRDTV